MNKIKLIVLTFAMLIGVAAIVPSQAASADAKGEILKGYNEAGGATETKTVQSTIKTVVNVLLYVIGVLSVIMIIVGGIKYTISAGDSSKVTSAKNTIMYAVVGLIVAILAYAIVNFVLTQL
jgi:hypothetical protein